MIQWIVTVLRAKAAHWTHLQVIRRRTTQDKIGRFYTRHALSVWTELRQTFIVCLAIKYKDGNKTHRPSDELAFVVPLSRLMRAVSVLKLERPNQTNNDCLPKFFQTDNESSSTKTAIILCLEESFTRTQDHFQRERRPNFHLFITSSSVLILYS